METGTNDIKFYRYEIRNYASLGADGDYVSSSIPNPKVELTEFNLHKETPKGYWIGYGYYYPTDSLRGKSHWISKTSKKRYAYPTKEEALKSFIYRQKYALKILDYQILNRKFALNIAESMLEKMKTI